MNDSKQETAGEREAFEAVIRSMHKDRPDSVNWRRVAGGKGPRLHRRTRIQSGIRASGRAGTPCKVTACFTSSAPNAACYGNFVDGAGHR